MLLLPFSLSLSLDTSSLSRCVLFKTLSVSEQCFHRCLAVSLCLTQNTVCLGATFSCITVKQCFRVTVELCFSCAFKANNLQHGEDPRPCTPSPLDSPALSKTPLAHTHRVRYKNLTFAPRHRNQTLFEPPSTGCCFVTMESQEVGLKAIEVRLGYGV
jgi:hypothetical protein